MNTLTLTTSDTSRNDVLALIDRANLAESSKQKYKAAVVRYLDAGGDLFDAQALAAYADGLGEASKAQLKAAIRLISNAMLDQLKGQADPSNVDFIRAAEYRTQALQDAVKVSAPKGQKTHTRLSRAEVIALLDTCNGDTLKAERDRLALGLLVAAGLRREEACSLTFDNVKQQPIKGKVRTVLAIQGKGKKNRTVPVSDNLANAIDQWGRRVSHKGRVLRSINQAGKLRDSLSPVGLFHVVRDHGAIIGKPVKTAGFPRCHISFRFPQGDGYDFPRWDLSGETRF